MNFVKPSTKRAVEDIRKFFLIYFEEIKFLNKNTKLTFLTLEENQRNFDLETKVRTIVADMLLSMNDRLVTTDKSVRSCQGDMITYNLKIDALNGKIERM